ncbi:MAG: DHH family phosphoesterase, partial [Rhodospirillaceae bacterium]
MDAIAPETVVFGVEKSFSSRRWLERDYDQRLAMAISQQYSLSEIIGRLLSARDVDLDAVETFLDPRLNTLLPDPGHLLDMNKAVERLIRAINDGEQIAVFGDYDVDGATSSALLKRFFRTLGVDLRIYIPDRMKEGYGPNIQALTQLKGGGTDVVITVDCGTAAYEPLEYAVENNLDVIVVDHHVA